MPEDTEYPRNAIARLQSLVLNSLLQQRPLPGQSEPIRFPDMAFIAESEAILIAAENAAGRFGDLDTGKPVRILPESEIRAEAAGSGDRVYVRFQPAQQLADQIQIVMEVRMAPTQADIHTLGLGGVRATFAQDSAGNWKAAAAPVVFAI